MWGLLAHSLYRLNAVDPGFNPRQVLGFNVSVPNDLSMPDRQRFYARALDELRTIPGVERAGMISFLPPELRAGVFMGLRIQGVPPPERGAPPRVVNTLVTSPDYFATMQMSIVGGRDLGRGDTASSPPVIVVNEAFARRYFPRGDALGHRIGTGFDGLRPVRAIVGVVRDAHDRGLAAEPIPTVYIAFEQLALPYSSFVVRTRAAAASVVPVVRDRLQRLNASVPVTDFQMLDERIHESLREPRFYTVMAMACAAMALFFVTFGLYGLVSYSVSQRTHELGIRMALGAQRGDVLRLVLLQGLRLSVAGVAAGVVVAMIGSRLLQAQLFHVQPIDPLTLGLAAAFAIVVTIAATLAPAYRASQVNPLAALRYE
jgi:putative ABC transport system permease protein